jgi:hypothetical protein
MAEHLAACPQLQRQAIFFVLEKKKLEPIKRLPPYGVRTQAHSHAHAKH